MSSPTPIPLLLDVDTGVDDALALLFACAHPGLDLRAVTCVGGNAGLDHVVANTMLVLQTAGVTDVPVAAGAPRPLLEPPRDAGHVHGRDGLGDLGRAAATLTPDPRHAVELLRDVLRAARAEPVTLVALAPMTNLALALRTYPDVVEGLARVVFMGGGSRGNATAAAEFNVWHDPEATAIVLDALGTAGVAVTMYGLDVFYAPLIDRDGVARLRAGGSPAAALAADLLAFSQDRFGGTATVGDAGAVAMLTDPAAVSTQRLPVHVELSGAWTRGQTLIDRRTWSGDRDHDPQQRAALVEVALDADGSRLAELWLDTVGAAPSDAAPSGAG